MTMRQSFLIFLTIYCIVTCYSMSDAIAYSIDNIIEINKQTNFTKPNKDFSIATVHHLSPRWNSDGSLLAFLETDSTNKSVLIVGEVTASETISFNRVFSFPNNKMFSNKKNKLPPGYYGNNQKTNRDSVEKISWAVNDPDIIVFQYKNEIYKAYPRKQEIKKFIIDKYPEEYPKLSYDGKRIIYGKNGNIFYHNQTTEISLITNEDFRYSNPVVFKDSHNFLFESYNNKIDCGIYLHNNKEIIKVVDYENTTEMLPTLSPDNQYLAFISNISDSAKQHNNQKNQLSGSKSKKNNQTIDFDKNQNWRLYSVKLNQALPVNSERWIRVSQNKIIKLIYRRGLPELCWVGNNKMMFIDRQNSDIYISKISANNPIKVMFNKQVGKSEIITMNTAVYSKGLIAFTALRNGFECVDDFKRDVCFIDAEKLFIGKLNE